jgi:hypothetical protein
MQRACRRGDPCLRPKRSAIRSIVPTRLRYKGGCATWATTSATAMAFGELPPERHCAISRAGMGCKRMTDGTGRPKNGCGPDQRSAPPGPSSAAGPWRGMSVGIGRAALSSSSTPAARKRPMGNATSARSGRRRRAGGVFGRSVLPRDKRGMPISTWRSSGRICAGRASEAPKRMSAA